MPTNRRKRPPRLRADLGTLTEDMERELRTGRAFYDGFPDLDSMRKAWEFYGEDLLAEWIAENPGSRPFAWWLFVGVPTWGERLIVGDHWDERHRANWLRHGILHTHVIPRFQEEQWEYLTRHGQLSAAEQQALAEAGWPRHEITREGDYLIDHRDGGRVFLPRR